MARPSKYNEKYHIPWIKGLAMRGLTVQEIAEEVGVATSTISKWMAENEELSEAVKNGRSFADTKVEASLYKRAIGYKYQERKTIMQTSKNGEAPTPRVEITEKEIMPDVLACIFWLKNRRPDLWRDRVENMISGKLETYKPNLDLSKIPTEVLSQVVDSMKTDK